MGTYYTRLTEVAHRSYDDSGDSDTYTEIVDRIAECRRLATEFTSDPGMTGKTATAALTWLAEYQTELTAKEADLKAMVDRHDLARAAMEKAKQQHSSLAPALLSPFESKVLPANGPYLVNGTEISGSAYVAQLRAERDVAREAAAKKILDTMNDAVEDQASRLHEPVDNTPDAPIVPGRPSGSGSRTATTSNRPGASVHLGVIQSPSYTSPVLTPGEPTIPTPSPVTPPLVTTPIGSTGPVNGYVPPSVLDADDSRWQDTYTVPGISLGAESGALVGGVIGIGAAALAARALASGLAGSSALALQTAAGAGSASALGSYSVGLGGAAGRVPGGGLLSSPASAARSEAAAATGAARWGRGTTAAGEEAGLAQGGRGTGGGRSGSAGGRGAVDSGDRAARGMSGAGRDTAGRSGRGGVGKEATAGAGNGRGDKAKRKQGSTLIGYDVQRLDDEAAAVDLGAAGGAGDSAQLAPLADSDAGDRW